MNVLLGIFEIIMVFLLNTKPGFLLGSIFAVFGACEAEFDKGVS